MARYAQFDIRFKDYADTSTEIGDYVEFSVFGEVYRWIAGVGNDPALRQFNIWNGRSIGAQELANQITAELGGRGIVAERYEIANEYTAPSYGVVIKAARYGEEYNISAVSVSVGFEVSAPVTNDNPPTVAVMLSHAVCFGSSTGSVSLQISGGVAPYAVLWDDGSTELNRAMLPAGNYSVTVTDSAEPQPIEEYGFVVGYTKDHPGVVIRQITIGQNNELKVTGSQDDDSITLEVEGGVAPYTFEWSDGSADQDRFGLNAGRYEVTVTDSVGCFKSFTFTLGQARFYYSHVPITLQLQAEDIANKPNLTFLCEVWVEKEYLSEQFEKVATLEHVADRDGSTVFEVQEFLQPFVGPYFPELDEVNTTMASGLFKRFYLRHTEKYGVVPTPGDFTVEDYRYVLRGGLSFEETARNSFYASYLPTQKPFLSWLPAAKLATTEQPEFLFLVLHQSGIESFVVKKRVTYADASVATSEVHTQESCQRFEVYCIPASYQALDLAAAGKEVLRWEVWCETAAGVAITETRTYTLDTRYSGYFRYLLYLNSLGGINTLLAVGQAEKTLDIETETMQRLLGAGTVAALGSTEITAVTAEPVLQLTSGYLSDQKELEALTDFALSREVRLVEGGRYRAGTKQVKKFTVLDEVTEERFLDFEFVLPTEKHYTPNLTL